MGSRPAWVISETLSQKQNTNKKAGEWFKWYSAYLANMRPRFNPQYWKKIKEEKRHLQTKKA
jgi:hypothetical protein